jgi:hypothetical protein
VCVLEKSDAHSALATRMRVRERVIDKEIVFDERGEGRKGEKK